MRTRLYRLSEDRSRGARLSKNRLGVFALVLALLLPALAQPAHATTAAETLDMAAIDRYVAAQLDMLRVPGASLGIIHNQEIVHLQGFGRADQTGRLMTAQTPTLIGSLTKSFTAVAMMQLVEAGKVELDAPVQRYLPWFRVADPEASAQITVRHLLLHTSGLPGRRETAILLQEDTANDAIERQVRALADVELTEPVGSTWQYASVNYATLGLIIETVSGRPYEEYIQERIFTPLQMEHSYSSPLLALSADLAAGHQYWFGQPRPVRLPYPRGLLPGGYLVSSAEDMCRYLIAHLNGGQFGEVRILSSEGVAELHRPGIAIDTGLWSGMGWGVADMDGVQLLQHSGNTNNYRSEMWLLPDTGWGFVLLTNASNQLQEAAIRSIGQGIAMLLLGQPPQAVTLNPATPVLYGVILVIAALELLMVARGVRTVLAWGVTLPAQVRWRQIIVPLAGHLLVALLFLVLMPGLLLGGSLATAVFLVPDLGYTLGAIGSLALGWALLRTLLALRLNHSSATVAKRVRGAYS